MSFQDDVFHWMTACFSGDVCKDVRERGDRLLEEVLELLQSHGYDKSRVATLVDYTFNRPVGEPYQEVGGVMVTLAAYCQATGLDMHACGAIELERIWHKIPEIRAKQESKRGLHTPLPVDPYSTFATALSAAERFCSDLGVRVVGVPPALGAEYGFPEDKIAADLTPAHYQPEAPVKWSRHSKAGRCVHSAGTEHGTYQCVYVGGHDGNHMIGYDDEDES